MDDDQASALERNTDDYRFLLLEGRRTANGVERRMDVVNVGVTLIMRVCTRHALIVRDTYSNSDRPTGS